jgi:DNA replication and repair protein RecF
MGCINKVTLASFRNYSEKDFTFLPGINLIHGDNGIGKSNLLESILISSIGRSDRTKNLKEAIQHGASKFYIDIFYTKEGLSEKIHINFDGKEKEILHNKTKHKSFSSLLGLLPSVLYSPADVDIITGEPKYRRRFMDIHLAQSDSSYILHLSRYNKALKHRNALLKTNDYSAIEIWEEQLAHSAAIIQKKRARFIDELEGIFTEEFSYFQHKSKIPKVIYKPSPKEYITAASYKESREKDFILGFTTVGPHRDDLLFSLDTEKAKVYSSEGEKRLMVIALKLASYRMMDAVIFAMDDYHSFLDKGKQKHLIERLKTLPQVFLTAPADFETPFINSISIEELRALP